MLAMGNLRKKANFKQEEIAEYFGKNRITISRWENGETSPSVDVLKTLSSLYGCTIDELLEVVGAEERIA